MKTPLNFFILSFLICVLSAKSNALNTSSASVSVNIITPISIEKVAGKDLHFGNIAPSKTMGTVILSSTSIRRAEGGATLPSTEGTVTAAEFVVSGENSYTFSISLPASEVILGNSTNSQTMIVDAFTSTPEATGVLTAGKQTIRIGARLNINADQSPGTYTSDPFYVIVNYN